MKKIVSVLAQIPQVLLALVDKDIHTSSISVLLSFPP